MKIYLIGMPGSGKTTLGQQFAEEMTLPFIDLDQEIEAKEQKSIPEIFEQQGEDYFRQVESGCLYEWAGSDKSFVMATGGGTPCFHKGIEVINLTGLSIFLDTPIDLLLSRLSRETGRPTVRSANHEELRSKLERMRRDRLQFYQQAQIIVQNPDLSNLLTKIGFRK
jgi:shikimate kinase